jgi:hypothetical protein
VESLADNPDAFSINELRPIFARGVAAVQQRLVPVDSADGTGSAADGAVSGIRSKLLLATGHRVCTFVDEHKRRTLSWAETDRLNNLYATEAARLKVPLVDFAKHAERAKRQWGEKGVCASADGYHLTELMYKQRLEMLVGAVCP